MSYEELHFSLQKKKKEPDLSRCSACDESGLVWVWVTLKNSKHKVLMQARCSACNGTKRVI